MAMISAMLAYTTHTCREEPRLKVAYIMSSRHL